jgi:hypothetical protein
MHESRQLTIKKLDGEQIRGRKKSPIFVSESSRESNMFYILYSNLISWHTGARALVTRILDHDWSMLVQS